jgi:guanine deaminase
MNRAVNAWAAGRAGPLSHSHSLPDHAAYALAHSAWHVVSATKALWVVALLASPRRTKLGSGAPMAARGGDRGGGAEAPRAAAAAPKAPEATPPPAPLAPPQGVMAAGEASTPASVVSAAAAPGGPGAASPAAAPGARRALPPPASALPPPDSALLRAVLERARHNVARGGRPFAAAVVRLSDGAVLAFEGNDVAGSADPTAHAEMQAIRAAARALGSPDLRGCEIYSSCEPCPMCAGACFWARLGRVVFAAGGGEAEAEGGFADVAIARELSRPGEARAIPFIRLEVEEGERVAPFRACGGGDQ